MVRSDSSDQPPNKLDKNWNSGKLLFSMWLLGPDNPRSNPVMAVNKLSINPVTNANFGDLIATSQNPRVASKTSDGEKSNK